MRGTTGRHRTFARWIKLVNLQVNPGPTKTLTLNCRCQPTFADAGNIARSRPGWSRPQAPAHHPALRLAGPTLTVVIPLHEKCLKLITHTSIPRRMSSELILHRWPGAWGLPSLSAECVAVEAYLRLAGLQFTVEDCATPYASPSGQVRSPTHVPTFRPHPHSSSFPRVLFFTMPCFLPCRTSGHCGVPPPRRLPARPTHPRLTRRRGLPPAARRAAPRAGPERGHGGRHRGRSQGRACQIFLAIATS